MFSYFIIFVYKTSLLFLALNCLRGKFWGSGGGVGVQDWCVCGVSGVGGGVFLTKILSGTAKSRYQAAENFLHGCQWDSHPRHSDVYFQISRNMFDVLNHCATAAAQSCAFPECDYTNDDQIMIPILIPHRASIVMNLAMHR